MPACFYYELLELLRKLLLTSIVIFIDPGTTAQLGWAFFIEIIFLVAHVMLQPYKDATPSGPGACLAPRPPRYCCYPDLAA